MVLKIWLQCFCVKYSKYNQAKLCLSAAITRSNSEEDLL